MKKITDAVEHIMDFLNGIPLSKRTICNYERSYQNSILPYCRTTSIDTFTDSEMRKYVEYLLSKKEEDKRSGGYFYQHRKAAALLADCMHGRDMDWKRRIYKKDILSECFENTLEDYITYLSQALSSGSIQNQTGFARNFMLYLESGGLCDLKGLTNEHVKEYITQTAPRYSASMSTLTGSIRKFLLYLTDAGITSINAERFLVNPAPRHKKLLPCFTDNEVDAVLNSVDRSTPLGKRDYAIMATALWTGLRSADVLGLKRLDVDWKLRLINVSQDKTDVLIQVSIPPVVSNAISDYILHGRPETDSPFIFVRHIRPYSMLRRSGGTTILYRYLDDAGISHEAYDGKTFHAFRRTLGTRLVRAGVDIRSVSEMLGQKNLDSAKRYVSLDNEGLRVCCMDTSAFKTKKEGLA